MFNFSNLACYHCQYIHIYRAFYLFCANHLLTIFQVSIANLHINVGAFGMILCARFYGNGNITKISVLASEYMNLAITPSLLLRGLTCLCLCVGFCTSIQFPQIQDGHQDDPVSMVTNDKTAMFCL